MKIQRQLNKIIISQSSEMIHSDGNIHHNDGDYYLTKEHDILPFVDYKEALDHVTLSRICIWICEPLQELKTTMWELPAHYKTFIEENKVCKWHVFWFDVPFQGKYKGILTVPRISQFHNYPNADQIFI